MTVPNAADLDRYASMVLELLWRSSWQASVLAGVVLLIQFALKRQLPARWRHALFPTPCASPSQPGCGAVSWRRW